MFYLSGTIISSFLVLLLLGKKEKIIADKLLAFWLTIIGYHLYVFNSNYNSVHFTNKNLIGITFGIPLLYGPLLFLYTKYRINTNDSFKKLDAIHFVPIVIIYLILLPDFVFDTKIGSYIFQSNSLSVVLVKEIIFVINVSSGIIYALVSLLFLNKYNKRIAAFFSNTQKINLNWLRLNTLGILATWLLFLFRNDSMFFNLIVLFIFCIGYFGIKQVGVFTDLKLTEIEEEKISLKYQKSILPLNEAERIQKELIEIMHSKKLFLNPELTLADVANELHIHPNMLSQVINSLEGNNFYDYINNLRVEEFKKLITQENNQKYTIIALAFECGFNSKATFNRCFKKLTHQTPSEYRKEVNKKFN